MPLLIARHINTLENGKLRHAGRTFWKKFREPSLAQPRPKQGKQWLCTDLLIFGILIVIWIPYADEAKICFTAPIFLEGSLVHRSRKAPHEIPAGTPQICGGSSGPVQARGVGTAVLSAGIAER